MSGCSWWGNSGRRLIEWTYGLPRIDRRAFNQTFSSLSREILQRAHVLRLTTIIYYRHRNAKQDGREQERALCRVEYTIAHRSTRSYRTTGSDPQATDTSGRNAGGTSICTTPYYIYNRSTRRSIPDAGRTSFVLWQLMSGGCPGGGSSSSSRCGGGGAVGAVVW